MVDRFILWFTRTWLLWCIAAALVCLTAPVKAYKVTVDTITSDKFWTALTADMDVSELIEDQAKQIMDVVPVDQLRALSVVLGEARTNEIVASAEEIRTGISTEIGKATHQSVTQVIGVSIPRFLMGKDLTGQQLADDLTLDLRPVKADLEAWLSQASTLMIDSAQEVAETKIREHMAPAVGELNEGGELEVLNARLNSLESHLVTVTETTQAVSTLIAQLENLGMIEDKESADAAKRLSTQMVQLSQLSVSVVGAGRTTLNAASVDGDGVDWEGLVGTVTDAMVASASQELQSKSSVLSQDISEAVLGTGTYALPGPARMAFIEQLRPAQVMIAPIVSIGTALNTVLAAGLMTLAVLLVLVAGRLRRTAFWLGGVGLITSVLAGTIASSFRLMAGALADGLGAVGQAAAEAGAVLSKVLMWFWTALQNLLDMDEPDLQALGGWTSEDVLSSATYGVVEAGMIVSLEEWSSTVMQASLIALAVWLGLTVLEAITRRQAPAKPGSILAVLQQPGGTRIEDPVLLLVPSRGTPVSTPGPHTAPSRLLTRGVWIDLSWILLGCLGIFTLAGLSALSTIGAMGAGALVVSSSAMFAAVIAGTGLVVTRLAFSTGRTVSGALAGEQLMDATGQSAPWRLRSLLAIAPWLIITAAALMSIAITESAATSLMGALGGLLVVEIITIVATGGSKTVGAVCMGRQCVPAAYGITGPHRLTAISWLTKGGTIWSLCWGLLLAGVGIGIFALITGVVGAYLWFKASREGPSALAPKATAYLRLGHWLSLDIIGIGLGLATLWLLQDDKASQHFSGREPMSEE